ncbi:unnamed protein product [Acanthoscelides obtectus]|uniref:Uncharacterized protein n=1 Tax=Acanthoscelides obtectus TaxID=200917 RepID=A0A9P0P5P0_ACAOB|nr:unnamed protein product [Acanthoscelides obtectus]CAK1634223.1 hypothetical protein AOBTE_LOCUS8675 [Acanthoscelides obtectus]
MAKTNELSIEKRAKIQVLHEQGKSQVDIAKTVKCSRRCVQYTIQRFSQTSSHKDRPRSGRKRITTDREDRILTRESLKNRKKLLWSSLPNYQSKLIDRFLLELFAEGFKKLV